MRTQGLKSISKKTINHFYWSISAWVLIFIASLAISILLLDYRTRIYSQFGDELDGAITNLSQYQNTKIPQFNSKLSNIKVTLLNTTESANRQIDELIANISKNDEDKISKFVAELSDIKSLLSSNTRSLNNEIDQLTSGLVQDKNFIDKDVSEKMTSSQILIINFNNIFLMLIGIAVAVVAASVIGLYNNYRAAVQFNALKTDYVNLNNRYDVLMGSKKMVDAELRTAQNTLHDLQDKMTLTVQQIEQLQSRLNKYEGKRNL